MYNVGGEHSEHAKYESVLHPNSSSKHSLHVGFHTSDLSHMYYYYISITSISSSRSSICMLKLLSSKYWIRIRRGRRRRKRGNSWINYRGNSIKIYLWQNWLLESHLQRMWWRRIRLHWWCISSLLWLYTPNFIYMWLNRYW